MRAAVVVILATITGIGALLSFKPAGLDSFGATANGGQAQVVAVPQSQTGVSQPRVRPTVTPRSSRSTPKRNALPATPPPAGKQQVKLPAGCKVTINGKDVEVTDAGEQILNLDIPENGTLTVRCKDGRAVGNSANDGTEPPQAPGQAEPGPPSEPTAPDGQGTDNGNQNSGQGQGSDPLQGSVPVQPGNNAPGS